ncbi:hypothetical protein [Haploplasma modicum]|uniref:hypothetical protein n=1 Tax=Haploplasma modicum TaxID=2150 RepID=UPI00047AC160|nr:hypothetical protein [Haploplasma modicum]
MKLKIKVLTSFILLIFAFIFVPLVSAASFHDEIYDEVSQHVRDGNLPSWHKSYALIPEYQTFYTKMVRLMSSTHGVSYLASFEKEDLISLLQQYKSEIDEVWEDMIENLDLELTNLAPAQIVGLYWETNVNEYASYLYFIWTSEYIPNEFNTLREIKINGKQYKQFETQQDITNYTPTWDTTDSLHFPNSNISVHRTAIGGFVLGEQFGVPLTQKYQIDGFKGGIEVEEFYGSVPDEKKYETMSSHSVTFDLGFVPKQDGKRAFQLVTKAYEILKDVEAQSYHSVAFGGYVHNVYFNTTIDIDRIYRVDVNYTLTSDNKNWYEFWLDTDEYNVTKSLTTERKSSGYFGLFNYQGFEEGNYKSNVKESKYYKYRLTLNYDDENWKIFHPNPEAEGNYKRFKEFKVLRLNYVVDDVVYDVPVKMDTVDSETLHILDRDLILDTESTGWKAKETIYDFFDQVKEKFEASKKTLIIIASVIVGLILFYIVYKIIRFINIIFSTKERK